MLSGNLKIALIQDQPGSGIRDKYSRILRDKKPDIIAFPEYFFVSSEERDVIASRSRHDEILRTLKEWSLSYNCAIVGGSVVAEERGRLFNRSYFLNDGEVIGHYEKIHPYRNEGGGLINKGMEYKVFEFNGMRIGIIICADVLYPKSYFNILGLKPDLIFVPTTSPYRENESPEVKFERDNRLFVRGAEITGSIIFKVCASGRIGERRFQARSLVATGSGIKWRNPPDQEDKSALIIIDLQCTESEPLLDIDLFRI